jgi:hypothetical protein
MPPPYFFATSNGSAARLNMIAAGSRRAVNATSAIARQRRDLFGGSPAHRLVPVHGLAGMLYSRCQTLCGITELHCY